MATYEYRRGGRTVERVRLVDGSLEDTRIGSAALDRQGPDGWHAVDTAKAAEKPTSAKPKPKTEVEDTARG